MNEIINKQPTSILHTYQYKTENGFSKTLPDIDVIYVIDTIKTRLTGLPVF